MKKKLAAIFSSIGLILVMIATLCACSTYNKVLRAYKKANYEETDIAEIYTQKVKEYFGEDTENVLTVHVLKKNAKEDGTIGDQLEGAFGYVIIAEFNSTKEMDEKMKTRVKGMTEEEKEDAKKLAEEVQKLDNVSGTCVYIFGTTTDGLTVFKSTK